MHHYGAPACRLPSGTRGRSWAVVQLVILVCIYTTDVYVCGHVYVCMHVCMRVCVDGWMDERWMSAQVQFFVHMEMGTCVHDCNISHVLTEN